MPPKAKNAPGGGKVQAQVVRPAISASSLLIEPEDLLPGFEERIETGISWTSTELAFRHHTSECRKEDLATISFCQALQNKIDASILGNIMKDSALSLEEQYELLPLSMWDNETFGTAEAKICFQSNNNITDDLLGIVKETMKKGDRKILKDLLKNSSTLRVIHCKMTELDEHLYDFKCLSLLNLSSNYIVNLEAKWLPPSLKALELQANGVATLNSLSNLPIDLVYLGLARNFLCNDCGLEVLRYTNVTVLDLSDNDIYRLEPTAEALSEMNQLSSLALAGNPCSLCAAYSFYLLEMLPRLHWLDWREVLDTDRPSPRPDLDAAAAPSLPAAPTVHPDDLRSAYFIFTCYRIIAIPQPPKAEKGSTMTFHVELEIPLLDSMRRQFLMYRQPDSLIQLLPEPEDYADSPPQVLKDLSATKVNSSKITFPDSKLSTNVESTQEDIYSKLTAKNFREILNYTVFESAHVPWAKYLSFQQPTVKIFCPDLFALRNTFRTDITVRLVFTMATSSKGGGGGGRKGASGPSQSEEHHLVLCSVACDLRAPDWGQKMQDFHWDDSLPSNRAIHWEGDLSVLHYNAPNLKPVKTKKETDGDTEPKNQGPPDNLTCHFGFGVETIRC